MPEITITLEQAWARVSRICKLRADAILQAQRAVEAAYANPPDHPAGPNVTMHRQIPEALASALVEIRDMLDLTIKMD